MRILVVIVRSLMGLAFLAGAIVYFFELITPLPLDGAMGVFNAGLEAAGYLIPLVKIIELVCGALFLTGRYVALASVLIAPIIVNIFLIHAFMDPKGLPVAGFLVLANLLVAWSNRERYQLLFRR